MTTFWILFAGLAGLALLFVVAPLLDRSVSDSEGTDEDEALRQANLSLFRQQLSELDADLAAGKLDQAQYDSARADLEREVLENAGGSPGTDGSRRRGLRLPGPRLTAVGLLVAVPAAAFALYQLVGSQEIMTRMHAGAEGQGGGRHPGSAAEAPSLADLVERLEQRLEQSPDDAQGWVMLGRSYFAMRDSGRAESALAKAYELLPGDPQVLLVYAEVLAANNDNDLTGRPAELIGEALQREPGNVTARWLSGMVAFQRGQFQSAAVTWRKVLGDLDPTSESSAQLRELIDTAEQRAGIPPEARTAAAGVGDEGASDAAPETMAEQAQERSVPVTAAGGRPEAGGARGADAASESGTKEEAVTEAIDVSVSLDPALAGRAEPGDTVFVYAKAAAGPPMPLAVQRVTVADLPAKVRLDDSMAMMPSMKLSSFPQLTVGARVSGSGLATPQPGDLEGETGPVSGGATAAVTVSIDRVRP